MQDIDLPFKNKFDLVVIAAIYHDSESFYFVYGSVTEDRTLVRLFWKSEK